MPSSKMLGGTYVYKAIGLCNWGNGMHKEENDLLIAVVEAAREYGQSPTAISRSILWDMLDFTRKRYGHPKQIASRSVIAQGVCALKSEKHRQQLVVRPMQGMCTNDTKWHCTELFRSQREKLRPSTE